MTNEQCEKDVVIDDNENTGTDNGGNAIDLDDYTDVAPDLVREIKELLAYQEEKRPKIIQYVKNPVEKTTNNVVGCMMANIVNDQIIIGYSFQHTYLDKYDKNKGLDIAYSRMGYLQNSKYIKRRIPPKHRPVLMMFVLRCKTYFKNGVLPEWVKCFLNDADEVERTRKYLEEFGTEYEKSKFSSMLEQSQ